jgi:hypothetical protein
MLQQSTKDVYSWMLQRAHKILLTQPT